MSFTIESEATAPHLSKILAEVGKEKGSAQGLIQNAKVISEHCLSGLCRKCQDKDLTPTTAAAEMLCLCSERTYSHI